MSREGNNTNKKYKFLRRPYSKITSGFMSRLETKGRKDKWW